MEHVGTAAPAVPQSNEGKHEMTKKSLSKDEFIQQVRKRAAQIAHEKGSDLTQSEVDARFGDRFYNECFKATPLGKIPNDKDIERALFGSD